MKPMEIAWSVLKSTQGIHPAALIYSYLAQQDKKDEDFSRGLARFKLQQDMAQGESPKFLQNIQLMRRPRLMEMGGDSWRDAYPTREEYEKMPAWMQGESYRTYE